MEPALILLTSTVLLAIAAAGRLVMAGIRFVGDRSPPANLSAADDRIGLSGWLDSCMPAHWP